MRFRTSLSFSTLANIRRSKGSAGMVSDEMPKNLLKKSVNLFSTVCFFFSRLAAPPPKMGIGGSTLVMAMPVVVTYPSANDWATNFLVSFSLNPSSRMMACNSASRCRSIYSFHSSLISVSSFGFSPGLSHSLNELHDQVFLIPKLRT